MKLYGFPLSGNAHRVQAFLTLLGIDHEYISVDLKAGAHKAPEFLAMNPLGQVPVLVDGDVVLRDSLAILNYLASKYDTDNVWNPAAPLARARVQEWLSIAGHEVINGPFLVRATKLFGSPGDPEALRAKTVALFETLFEPHLADRDWLVGDTPTLADIACYSCMARVTEGDFSLEPYPAIRAWLARVEAIEGFPPMVRIEDVMAAA